MTNLIMTDPTVWVLASFAIFAIAAIVFGRKILFGVLDSKIDAIRAEISAAENLRNEAQKLLAEYETKQKAAQSEAERLIASAKQQAADLHKRANQELTETIQRREAMLKERIQRMEESAIDDIRRYAADLAVSATTEIIAQKLDQASANRLADESIRKISGNLN